MDYLHKIENEIKELGFEIISKDFEMEKNIKLKQSVLEIFMLVVQEKLH